VVTATDRLQSDSPEHTEAIAEELARSLRPGDLLLVTGDLAAGKTTFVRGLVRGLGGDPDEVSSPTFVLVQSYPCHSGGVKTVHHVDLYRLADSAHELRGIGVEDLVADPVAVVAVEWPRTAFEGWIPAVARVWRVAVETVGGDRRTIAVARP